jgi:AcrR family transcriptional regulator
MRDYDGKTAAERIAERRERLIAAGFAVFGESGYEGTSVRAILRRAGLQERYFAESFSDVDSLLAAVYDRLMSEQVTLCRAAIAAAPTATDGARAMIETISRSFEESPDRARIKLLREVGGGGPVARQQRAQGLEALASLVAGLLPPGDETYRRLVGIAVVGTGNELLIRWLEGDHQLTRGTVVDLVMLVFQTVLDRMSP